MVFIHVSSIRNEVKHVVICVVVSVNFPVISLQDARSLPPYSGVEPWLVATPNLTQNVGSRQGGERKMESEGGVRV